jgi:glycosyltransferase involved in cell wall biosynthesis
VNYGFGSYLSKKRGLKNILFIVSHRSNRAPNQRFRYEQYLRFLEERGFHCVISALIKTQQEDKLFYNKGNYFSKIVLGVKMAFRRLKDVRRADQFDLIFIVREAFISGSIFFEKRLKANGAKIIYDFDDSIWLNVISANNLFFSWVKDASKTAHIIGLSDLVFAGNFYLASYAKSFNSNVVVIPTTVNTDTFIPNYNKLKEKITIGWSGSPSTIEHFEHAIPALVILKEKYKDKIDFKVIGDGHYFNDSLSIKGLAWNSESEVEDLQTIDIGIMPLPDDEWTKGKCGLKGLVYMALEIPTVMSPVGVNTYIISDGTNGFLADTISEWVHKLSLLIENPELRVKLGREGRQTVVNRFSVHSQKENYYSQIKSLLSI